MLEYSSTTVPTDVQNNYLHPIPPMLNERFFSAEKIAIPSTNKSHSRKSYIVSAGPRLQVRSLRLVFERVVFANNREQMRNGGTKLTN